MNDLNYNVNKNNYHLYKLFIENFVSRRIYSDYRYKIIVDKNTFDDLFFLGNIKSYDDYNRFCIINNFNIIPFNIDVEVNNLIDNYGMIYFYDTFETGNDFKYNVIEMLEKL